ncbi:MAG: HEAT repeat domain-containing protein [Planctomycetota bacterium]|jgi:HEAT repeat protein
MIHTGWLRLVALLALAAAVGAESYDPHTITLGYLTEHADAAVTVTAGTETAIGDDRWRVVFTIGEVLRGRAEGATLEIERRASEEAYPVGTKYLAFLSRVERNEWTGWRPVTRTFGMRALPEAGPETRFPGIVRDLASTLGEGREVRDPVRLRALLVQGMADPDAGIAWSSALDLVRHTELHEGLSAEQRATILDAYRRQPIGKMTKRALAYAVAATRDSRAGDLLLESLQDPRARLICGAVAEALRRLAEPSVPGKVVEQLKGANAERRVHLFTVLGRLGAKESAEAAVAHLDDPAPPVRLAAAHALGLTARALRADDPTVKVGGIEKLKSWLGAAKTENEIRACLWALAQLDAAEAYDVLRTARDDEREVVRRYVAAYLRFPRQ